MRLYCPRLPVFDGICFFFFLRLQDMIDRAIVDIQAGRKVVEPGTYMQQFPYPCYVYDQ